MKGNVQKPPLLFTLLEGRIPLEIGAQIISSRFYERNLPRGERRLGYRSVAGYIIRWRFRR